MRIGDMCVREYWIGDCLSREQTSRKREDVSQKVRDGYSSRLLGYGRCLSVRRICKPYLVLQPPPSQAGHILVYIFFDVYPNIVLEKTHNIMASRAPDLHFPLTLLHTSLWPRCVEIIRERRVYLLVDWSRYLPRGAPMRQVTNPDTISYKQRTDVHPYEVQCDNRWIY